MGPSRTRATLPRKFSNDAKQIEECVVARTNVFDRLWDLDIKGVRRWGRWRRHTASRMAMPANIAFARECHDKEERTPMNDFGCTSPILPPRMVLKMYKISTEDLSDPISFPSSLLNL